MVLIQFDKSKVWHWVNTSTGGENTACGYIYFGRKFQTKTQGEITCKNCSKHIKNK